jgi:hypothetical protein
MAQDKKMSIDYEQLKTLVKEAMFTGGGINEPSAPEGIPIRMPAADISGKEQDMGDPKANKLYEVALKARETTEELIEKLDQPIYDDAYEHAFKASACLRRALNSLIESGAHPMPWQQVVPPPSKQQKFGNYVPYQGALTYGTDSMAPTLVEQEPEAEPAAAKPAGMRAKKIATAAAAGGAQSKEEIEQQLASVLTGKGVTPIRLRDALISLLTDLGLSDAKRVAVLIAKGLAAKQKKQQGK